MSNVERREIQTAIQRVEDEISRLSEQQTAAEKIAALVGMTTDDSRQYKERHSRIKRLTRELAELGSEQGAHHEQKEAQEIARHGTEGA
jgi:DNA repair exonuclease SbcCD ATPase subunit